MLLKQNHVFTFPKDFLWGAATSAHQVEGANTLCDWWRWEETGRVRERSLAACDHYTRFESDFDLAKQLSHNAHRLSIEWSRLEPEKGRWNEAEFDHYKRVIDALRARNMEPVVTLHHFTNPQWLANEGGWESRRVVDHFARFSEKAAAAFGKSVQYWVTINEPMVFLYQSFILGEWPPGGHSPRVALRVLRHLLLAHIRSYQAIHETIRKYGGRKPMVGLAKHMTALAPCSPASALDRLSAWLRHVYFNHLFLKALQYGFLFFPGIYFEPLPMRRSFDYIGLNYYTREFIHFAGFDFPAIFGDACSLTHHQTAGERNMMGWEVYPKGLFDILLDLKRYQVPVLITENGICTNRDDRRKEFLHRHLVEVAHAIEKKVPVIGYLHWSLLDNFEWAYGFGPRFGLIDVDFKTQARTIRESARYYAEICKSNWLSI